ncbi:MAG: efflux transporter outer membrane subunit [Kiritimatiellae bacterium]|nr:efflux transporter outer membrane subunit [Kiritimatiellia bacterium]MBQ6330901.1 efflux transporter outer membrane subunit [Kiritimatiellia bacterium]
MRREMKIAAGALLAAAGCASLPSVGPNYEEPELRPQVVSLPDAGLPSSNLTASCEYRPAGSNEDTRVVITTNAVERWWESFGDPVLDSLVTGGVTNNISYKMAQTRLRQAAWELFGSYAGFLPQFDVGGKWRRSWYSPRTSSGGGSYNHANVRSATLDGDWEIDVFGGTRRLVESAFAEMEASRWKVSDSWVSLTTQIGMEYISLRTMQERIEVARTNLVLQSETYDILKSRLDSGIGDELAVNQCAYIVEQTRARLPQLLAQEEALKNALAILVGEVPGALHETLRPLQERRDWLLDPQRVSELSLGMMRARPDVRAAERALAAQTARIGIAKAAWFPRLFVTGTVGFENRHKSRLFSRESFFASIGPSVSWPIFQGGSVYANVKAAEEKTAELALDYELALDKACGEVRDAYSAYTQEYHRYKALRNAVKAATDAVTISQDLYKNGLKDFNNVLDAQRSRLQLEEEFVVSRGQISTELIRLYRALGGGLAVPDPDEGDVER